MRIPNPPPAAPAGICRFWVDFFFNSRKITWKIAVKKFIFVTKIFINKDK